MPSWTLDWTAPHPAVPLILSYGRAAQQAADGRKAGPLPSDTDLKLQQRFSLQLGDVVLHTWILRDLAQQATPLTKRRQVSWEWPDALCEQVRGQIWGAFLTSPESFSKQYSALPNDARGQVRACR